MQMYLQMGHGMMGHARELLAHWGGDGGAILSPRDMQANQMSKLAQDLVSMGGEVLVDPQCYVREADHHRLVDHDHWAVIQTHTTSGLLSGAGAGQLLDEVQRMNDNVGASRRIIPGLLASDVDEDWFAFQSQFIGGADARMTRPFLATVAVGKEPMRDEAKIEAIVERAEGWDVDGFYVVAEAPDSYLIDDPIWLANLLILTSGLKLLGLPVIVGYSNHQGISLAAANVDVIASGTWLNVRAFDPDKFFTKEASVSRRSKWYYCPQAFSEYKAPFLDVAHRIGMLRSMKPKRPCSSHYCAPLFSGAQPSSVEWGETLAFRHYLDSLYAQVESSRMKTFDQTMSEQEQLLDVAENLLGDLRSSGVRGANRDFGDYVDVNRSALALHNAARGAQLRRYWK